jgi:hypothetical protein
MDHIDEDTLSFGGPLFHPRLRPSAGRTEWPGNASPPPEETEEIFGEGDEDFSDDHEDEEEEEEEGEDGASETSSAMYDAEADPEGYAQRLDELAGVLEIGERESRALKWGPGIGRERDGTLSQWKYRLLMPYSSRTTPRGLPRSSKPPSQRHGMAIYSSLGSFPSLTWTAGCFQQSGYG